MLSSLTVRNFAIVTHLDLEFSVGMTVITGETGAGKSILLDALGLALGDRGQADLVRPGAERLEVHAGFRIGDLAGVSAWLEARDLLEDDECVLGRTIHKEGRSRAFINGRPVTVADLRKLGEMLIDIHGQHEHQSLMRRDQHLDLLDQFAGLEAETAKVAQLHREWKAVRDEIAALRASGGEQAARLDLLRYQIDELDRLAVDKGETESLETEFRRLTNAGETLESGQRAHELLAGEDGSATTALQQALALLESIDDPDPRLRSAMECLSGAVVQADEAVRELRTYTESVEIDPQRAAEVEQRLDAIHATARKHRVRSEELPQLHASLREQLDIAEHGEERAAGLEKKLLDIEADYGKKAGKLTKQRKRAAKELDALIQERVQDLGLPGARFETRLEAAAGTEPRPRGGETAEFLVSLNPGQPLRPLTKVASGGELSRIGLAICVVTAERARHPTLVFDEVDTGIGGAVAEMVGRQLRELGAHGQAICVTHLPQVAALGHHHLYVSKSATRDSTATEITRLEPDEKVSEIARMLGGLRVSEESLAHAREMLEYARD